MANELDGTSNDNPFDRFLTTEQPAAPTPSPPDATSSANPFDQFLKPPAQPYDPSAIEAGLHHAEGGVLPAAGGLAGFGIGAAAGAPLGPLGSFVGGVIGGFGGSTVISAAQNWALSQLPESWQDALGQGEKQRQAEEQKQPVASYIGGLVPYLLTMKPGGAVKLPENATAIERLMANPLTSHLFGGAVTGGMELGTEVGLNHEKPDWTKVAIATAFGTIFNEPNRLGQSLTEIGGAPARQFLGQYRPWERFATPPATPEVPASPTVAQAGDAKVLGPGIDESVFMGAHEQAPEALMTAQETARTEATLLRPEESTPSVATVARRSEPDLFTHYDELQAQRDDLTAHWSALSEASGGNETPEMQAISKQIIAADLQLRAVAPDVGAAYRRAADRVQSPTVEPQVEAALEGAAPPSPQEATISEQKGPSNEPNAPSILPPKAEMDAQQASIAQQVAANLVAAGQSQELAEANAALWGHYYRTRSAKFKGALGTPMEVYQRDAPIIRGYGSPPPSPTAPVAPAEARIPPLMPTEARPTIAPERSLVQEPPVSVIPASEAPATGGVPLTPPPENVPENRGAPASEIEAIDPANIGVDAQRFQFKAGGDQAGITERLQGVEKWDPRLAGTALVFRDANGANWIADGHQRIGLANRLMEGGHPPIKINAFVLDAKDGITEADARAIAATKNIAEGTGSAVDAAKVIREAKATGIDLPPLPPRSALVRDGNALAELSPEAFGIIINDVVPVQQGAIVGRMVRDPAQQVEALKLLAAMKPENVTQAEMVVRDMLSSGTEMTTQGTLFGDEAFASSIVRERAKIADEALKQLRRDKQTFKTLVDEAERIQGAGANVLDQTANQGRLSTDEQASDFLKQLAFRAGPVSDALSDVARQLKSGAIKPAEAARSFLGAVRRAAEEGVVTGPSAGRVEPSATGERQELATEPGVEGLPQTLIPGVEPITDAQRVALEASRPLAGGEAAPGGLFDEEVRNQQELFQQKRGAIELRPSGRNILKLFAEANASTFAHESAHQWLEDLMKDSAHPAAPDALKDDAQTVRDWLGVRDIGDPIKTGQHEKFARGFEQYVREGVAPSPGLARVFAQFKTWLTQIYQSIKGLGSPINDDIRSVFDRMLAEEPNRTVISPDELAREPSLPSIHEAEANEAAPHEANAISDRIVAERDDYLARQPIEVQNEIAAVIAQREAEERAAAGIEPAGETGAGAGGPGEVVAGGVQSGAEPAGITGGGEHGPELGGRSDGVPQGAGRGGAPTAEPDAGLRQQRPQSAGNAGTQSIAPTPATLFGSEQSPFVDKAGNIRIDNLTSDQDVAQAIRDAAQENNDFIGDRRGVITDGQVLDLADALGMDVGQLNRRRLGEAFNAEQVVAARKLLIQSATDVRDVMARAASPNATDQDVLAYAHAKARHQMIQAQVAGITAEAGRALRAFRSLVGDAEAQGVDQFIRTATGKTLFQLKEEAKLGSQLDTPAKVSKFVRDAQKRGFGSMVLEYWINGLISGPATHTTYMVGNTILSLHKAGPETLAAAMIGRAAQALGREGEVVHFGEAAAKLRGAGRGLPAATQAAVDALRTGVTTLLPGETPRVLPFQPGSELARSVGINENARYSDFMPALFGTAQGIQDGIVSLGALLKAGGVTGAPMVGLRYSPLGAIPDIAVRGVPVLPLGTIARVPSRAIAAIHSFFRTMNYSMEKNALAYRSAVDSGKTGTDFDAHVANMRQNPTPDMMEAAVKESTNATLMGQGSEFVQALGKLTNVKILGFPFLKFVDPFVHIAGNIIDQSIVQRTPLGILAPEVRADLMGKNGTVAQDTTAARMLVGTALSIGFGSLAAQGLMSGSGPSDPRKAAVWRLAGNQPHSVRIGDMWYDVHRLGPLGMLASVAADMYDVAHSLQEGDMGKVGASLLQAFTHTMLDEGFGRGPADLIQALTDPQRYGPAYVRNQIASFVPFSVGMGQIARAQDPYARQSRSIMDAIKAKVPGLSESLMPRRDIWGQPLPSTDVLGPPGLSAIYATQANNDPVNHALLNLGIYPAQPERAIRGVQLTDQQYDEFSVLSGSMAKQQLDKIVGSSQFSQWPAATQHQVIEATITAARETARNVIMARNPQIAVEAVRNKLAKLQPPAEE